MYMTQVRLPMSNAESLVAKAHEWIDQVGHELGWDENRTKARKSKCAVKTVFSPLRFQTATVTLCQSVWAFRWQLIY